jgi:hypothetical protein
VMSISFTFKAALRGLSVVFAFFFKGILVATVARGSMCSKHVLEL